MEGPSHACASWAAHPTDHLSGRKDPGGNRRLYDVRLVATAGRPDLAAPRPQRQDRMMRDNPLKQRLARGGLAVGTLVFEFFTPGIATIMSVAGADFAIYDCEHGGVGIETIKQQMAYARHGTCVPMVRVPGTDYTAIAAALDAGALGIMAPMVESAGQAAELVACTRYPPAGRRGAAFQIAHDDFAPGSVAEKIAQANARTLVIALIETAAGVANVETIAATPGIDVLWLGHFDLTNSMGIPGEFEHPDYLGAVNRIVAAATSHKLSAGVMAGDVAWGRRYMELGFRMISYGLDHLVFQAALARGIADLRAGAR